MSFVFESIIYESLILLSSMSLIRKYTKRHNFLAVIYFQTKNKTVWLVKSIFNYKIYRKL